IALVNDYTTIASQSITTPAAGSVLVIGTAQAQANHTTGSRSWANFGVSTSSTSVPANQTAALEWPSELPSSGLYRAPVTVQSIFEVASAGTYTFYFLGIEYNGSFMCYDRQISLIYFPTAYGSVSSAGMVKTDTDDISVISPPITEADVNAQRMESISANDARVQRELAEMRAEIEALKRDMQENK
ncbi:hypothetical protein J7M07_08515, partial [bacterium]|nr:hypothetical protein [bacterium]